MSDADNLKPAFRGNWTPSVPKPAQSPNFSVPIKSSKEIKIEEPEPEPEPVAEIQPGEGVVEPEPEAEPKIQEEEPVAEIQPEEGVEPEPEAEPEIQEEEPEPQPIVKKEQLRAHTMDRPKPRGPVRPPLRGVPRAVMPKKPVHIKGAKEYAQDQLMDSVINHLSAERSEIHERELARELNKFKEATNDRTLQRQLDNIQFQISTQLDKQRKEEAAETARQLERDRRRQMLQRMINDLQGELDTELEAEQKFQEYRKKQREETITEFKKWDCEIQRVRDRIDSNRDKVKQEREKEERADSEKVGKVQKLYYDALHHKDPDAVKKLPVPSTYRVPAVEPSRKTHRKGKPTTTPGSDALNRLLDKLQGLESDSDSDEDY